VAKTLFSRTDLTHTTPFVCKRGQQRRSGIGEQSFACVCLVMEIRD